jgi:hypothetical protein
MYGALWRVLPGGWKLKVVQLVVLAAAALCALALWVFPWIDSLIAAPATVG